MLNKKIEEILVSNLDKEEIANALIYLSCIYNNKFKEIKEPLSLDAATIDILKVDVIDKNYDTGELSLKIPLFENEFKIYEDEVEIKENTKGKDTKLELLKLRVVNLVPNYRNLFKGIKPGSQGSKSGCYDKMLKFLKVNTDVTDEQILKATELYISKTEPTFIQQAHYFISKDKNSNLESWIDELDCNGGSVSDNKFDNII